LAGKSLRYDPRMHKPVVTDLHVYPVKSCRGTRVNEAVLTETGLLGDRMFQVIDGNTLPVTQRQQPAMATVRPALVDGGLRLEADGIAPLEVESPTTNDTTATSLLGVSVQAADAGDDAAAWFTELLGQECRLVGLTDDSDAHLPLGDITVPLSWADASPILVANTASLDWLVGRSSEPFTMSRFRPNVTVDAGEAWVEDTWSEFTIGEAGALLPLPWPRCAIPQIDQITGARHKEPARVLREHRWCTSLPEADGFVRAMLEGNALFGVACSLGPAGTRLRVGDDVTVVATAVPLLAAPR